MTHGALVLDDLEELLARYVAFPSEQARTAVVLWVAHTHALPAFESTPRLGLLSPEKGSGKTRTLEVIALVVPNPVHAVNMSAAALFRVVADQAPTLLLDEADTYLGRSSAKQHEDLRGLINSGHRRGAMAYRAEVRRKTVAVVPYPAFAACALAGIGDLPDTILDRSVLVAMKRRAPDEHVEPFRERIARPGAESLRDRLAAWLEPNVDELAGMFPDMPEGIVDRAADVWEPLLAIADLAGAHWPERARASAVALNSLRAERDPSLGVQLLRDCRRVFTDRGADRLTTEELVAALCVLEDAPWGDLRGRELDARGLARRLRKYDVRPAKHRFGDTTARGYLAEAFHDAWRRYLPADVPDVPHVPHLPTKRESDNAVPDRDSYVPNVLFPIPLDASLSPTGEAEQAEQAERGEHAGDLPGDEEAA